MWRAVGSRKYVYIKADPRVDHAVGYVAVYQNLLRLRAARARASCGCALSANFFDHILRILRVRRRRARVLPCEMFAADMS